MTLTEGGLRELLVRQALRLLEADGEIPSLRAVARAAGISAMTPYSYFDGKAALMGAVADCGFDALTAALEAAGREGSPADALVAQGVAYVRFAIDNVALFRLLCSREYDHGRSDAVGRTEAVLSARVLDVIPSRTTAATLAYRSLLQGMATIVLDDGRGRIDLRDVEESIRILVDGCIGVPRV